MLPLKRRLYQLILRLHPASFRDRFAREMSLDFEDALATYGFPRLLADAAGSLGRQWTAAPISFARTAPVAPSPLHPLLAGQYLVLEGEPLTPFELLRGTLLFAVMLFVLSLALKHGGNYIHSGHLPGLPTNQTDTLQRPQDGPFMPTPGDPSRNAVLIHPDRNLSLHPESARYFVRTEGHSRDPLSETWGRFFLRCAVISAIVWLTSLLVRRNRGIGVRVAFVALGMIAVVLASAYTPAPAPPAHAQALKGRFALTEYLPALRPLPQPLRDVSFQAATIRLQHSAPEVAQPPASGLAGAPDMESGDGIRITLPIRSLIASASGMPESRIAGGPAWLWLDTYDIQAKIDGTELAALRQMSPGQQQYQIELMEQSLLVTRFHLKAHEETRTLPGSTVTQPVEVLVIDHIDRPSAN